MLTGHAPRLTHKLSSVQPDTLLKHSGVFALVELQLPPTMATTSCAGFGVRPSSSRRPCRPPRQRHIGITAAFSSSDDEESAKALEDRIAAGEFTDKGSTKERLTRPLRRALAADPLGPGAWRGAAAAAGTKRRAAAQMHAACPLQLSWQSFKQEGVRWMPWSH